jgi:hypothetical protein
MHSVHLQNVLVLIVGVHSWKLLMEWIVLSECGDFCYTPYLLNFPPSKSHKFLNQGIMGPQTMADYAVTENLP